MSSKIKSVSLGEMYQHFFITQPEELQIDNTKLRQVRGCMTKRVFETREAGQQHVDFVNNRNGDDMSVYKCEFCEGYHVGHHYKKRKINIYEE